MGKKFDEYFLPRSSEELEGHITKHNLAHNAQAMKSVYLNIKSNLIEEKEKTKRVVDKAKENFVVLISILAIFLTSYPAYIADNGSLELSFQANKLLCFSIGIFFTLSIISLVLNTKSYVAKSVGKHTVDSVLKLFQYMESNPPKNDEQQIEIEGFGRLTSLGIVYLCKLELSEFNSNFILNSARKQLSNSANIFTAATFFMMLVVYSITFFNVIGE